MAKAYNNFSQFLSKVASRSKQVSQLLMAKANESLQNAKREITQCQKVMAAAAIYSPINKFCLSSSIPGREQATTWPRMIADRYVPQDPKSPDVEVLQKKIFVDAQKWGPYLELAQKYLQGKNYRHAVALSTYGMSTFPQAKDDFAAIMGCGLIELGLYNEASFHLKNVSDYQNLKGQCASSLKARVASL